MRWLDERLARGVVHSLIPKQSQRPDVGPFLFLRQGWGFIDAWRESGATL